MFDKDKYITSHANEVLPVQLQLNMWQSIEQWRNEDIELDYLQIFNLSVKRECNKVIQVIQHLQEEPEKKETICIECIGFKPITDKVYIIDDGPYSTMLMASDY